VTYDISGLVLDDGGKELAAELNSEGGPGEALYVQCDVVSEDDIKSLIDITVEKYGRIDCLINNAGSRELY